MKCLKCGTEYNGNFCPNCGKKYKKPVSNGRKVVGIILVIFGILIVFTVAISSGNNNSDSSTPSSQTSGTQSGEIDDKENKVNYANFEKIENGMTYEQVVEIFGEEGKVLSSVDIGEDEYATTIYYWYDDTGIANCNITIQGGKVVSKAQIGLK